MASFCWSSLKRCIFDVTGCHNQYLLRTSVFVRHPANEDHLKFAEQIATPWKTTQQVINGVRAVSKAGQYARVRRQRSELICCL